MKIVVGSLQHETNTFSPVTTTFADFDVSRGREMLEKIAVTGYLVNSGVEIIPTIYANALPSGIMEKKSFLEFKDELLKGIPADGNIDGVWLHLHGAMEVENLGSGEEALLRAVRAKIGYQVPIAVAMDFHANIPDSLAQLANIICGYRTAPHIDIEETQIKAAELLVKCIQENLLPEPAIVKISIISRGDVVTTDAEPVKSFLEKLEAVESDEELLCVSFFNGQPWVDAPNAGASIVAVAKSNTVLALEKAKHLAALFWKTRNDFHFKDETAGPEQAVNIAMNSQEHPVFISDSGDNTTGGAAGDNALLLKILLDKGVKNALVAGITDSRVVSACRRLCPGEKITFVLGAELDKHNSQSVRLEGIFKKEGAIPSWGKEGEISAVVIEVNGIDIIVTEKRSAFISINLFESLCIDLLKYAIVVFKLGYLFPELKNIARRTILALTPGTTCEEIEKCRFYKIKRPMFPFDLNFEWNP